MGAFIIALIRFIRIVFYHLAKKAEKASGDNAAIKCVVACANCCLKCIEKICDYLNEAAFCYHAVTGDHFCRSAWEGFLLNLKHGLEFAFANLIAKVFIFIGKVGIVCGNCFTLVFIMNNITKDSGSGLSTIFAFTPDAVRIAIKQNVVLRLDERYADELAVGMLAYVFHDVIVTRPNAVAMARGVKFA